MKKFRVVEIFKSIQGEGWFAGTPSIFVRLGGCNLLCGLDLSTPLNQNLNQTEIEKLKSPKAKWVCDTIEVWLRSGVEYSVDELINHLLENYENDFKKGYHLIITGGEPFLYKKILYKFIGEVSKFVYVEVETNGTIEPEYTVDNCFYNVSPKLSNSNMPFEKRINTLALKKFDLLPHCFKFVVFDEEDVEEVVDIVNNLKLTNVMLMPAVSEQKYYNEMAKKVVEYCKKYGFRFSPRIHIELYDKKTGV